MRLRPGVERVVRQCACDNSNNKKKNIIYISLLLFSSFHLADSEPVVDGCLPITMSPSCRPFGAAAREDIGPVQDGFQSAYYTYWLVVVLCIAVVISVFFHATDDASPHVRRCSFLLVVVV